MGSLAPMVDQIEQRTGCVPDTVLADAGHANHACISNLVERGVLPLVSVPKRSKNPGANANDEAAVDAWRHIMQTPDAKELYRARAGLCELPNAQFKSRFGLERSLVRGLCKVTSVVLLTAIASNLLTHAAALLS